VAQAHLRHINPFPRNLGDVLRAYDKVLVPEMNLGQLAMLLRAKYLVDIQGINQVRGMPFKSTELVAAITAAIETLPGTTLHNETL
jgi:2-oxoglutarate/2-oxoacid ferredoxin oxidoreductase subunit alpha